MNLNGLKNLPGLLELIINKNKKVKEFGDIGNMPKLQRLIMKGCKIKVFEDKLPKFPELQHIDLSGNKIANLKEIEKMK